jgi:hypothetical protein
MPGAVVDPITSSRRAIGLSAYAYHRGKLNTKISNFANSGVSQLGGFN